MNIETNQSQQTTCNATAVIGGSRRHIAACNVSIRPGRGISINLDLLDDVVSDQLDETDREEIAAQFAAYLAEEIRKARDSGIPIQLPTEEMM